MFYHHQRKSPSIPLFPKGEVPVFPSLGKEGLGEIYVLCLITLTLLVPSMVAAHTVHVEQEIGLVLHVDPNDSPIAGQESQVFVELSDTTHRVTLDQCECVATVRQGEREIWRELLIAEDPADLSDSFRVTFPERGDYVVTVGGDAFIPGTFDPFEVSAPIKLTRAPNRGNLATQASHTPHLIAAVVIAGIVIFDLIRQRLRTRKTS